MVGMSAYAEVPLTNETTSAAVEAISTNGTNAVAEAVDETSALTPKEQVERVLQEFAKRKGDGFRYGSPNPGTEDLYYGMISDVAVPLTNQTYLAARQRAFEQVLNSIAITYGASLASATSEESEFGTGYLNEEFRKKEITRDSIRGVCVVRACEAFAADGTAAVGIIAKVNPLVREVARCASKGVRPKIPQRPEVALRKAIGSGTDEELSALGIGTRFYYNEEGLPEIVSIGQSPVGLSENPVELGRRQSMALTRAEQDANLWLTQFLSGELVSTSRLEASDDKSKVRYVCDFKISARASMRGRIVAAKKIIRHATGHEIAFVALRLPVWSLPEEKPEQKTAPAKAATSDKQYDF